MKLTDAQKGMIWTLHLSGRYYQREIAEAVGTTPSQVNRYVKTRTECPCSSCEHIIKERSCVCVRTFERTDPTQTCPFFQKKL